MWSDWLAALRVLSYLAGTVEHKITYFRNGNAVPFAHSDSDWAKDVKDRKSLMGACIMFAGGLVSWTVKKQPIIALSTTEAELVAADTAGRDLKFFRHLLTELGEEPTVPSPLFIDNNGAAALAQHDIISRATRHIGVRYFHLRHSQQEGCIEVKRVSSQDNVADLLTKPLARQAQQAACLKVFGPANGV